MWTGILADNETEAACSSCQSPFATWRGGHRCPICGTINLISMNFPDPLSKNECFAPVVRPMSSAPINPSQFAYVIHVWKRLKERAMIVHPLPLPSIFNLLELINLQLGSWQNRETIRPQKARMKTEYPCLRPSEDTEMMKMTQSEEILGGPGNVSEPMSLLPKLM